MKKITALIANTYYTAGFRISVVFFCIACLELTIGVAIPAARSILLTQGIYFLFMAIAGSALLSQDQIIGALLLPVNGHDFVLSKLILTAAVYGLLFAVMAAALGGCAVYLHREDFATLVWVPAALFPLACTVSMLCVTLLLSGKALILTVTWILVCTIPGFMTGFFHSGTKHYYSIWITFVQTLHIPLVLVCLYVLCAGILWLCYRCSVRNFGKMQFNQRYMRVDRQK